MIGYQICWKTLIFVFLTNSFLNTSFVMAEQRSSENSGVAPSVVAFLTQSNQPQICFLSQLNVLQTGQQRPIYFQVGNEEKNRNLQERPILKPAPKSTPFVREIKYIARIDRSQATEIEFSIETLISQADGTVQQASPSHLYISVAPSKHGLEKYIIREGKVTYRVPPESSYRDIRFQLRGADQHEVHLVLLNEKKPVTIKHNKE